MDGPDIYCSNSCALNYAPDLWFEISKTAHRLVEVIDKFIATIGCAWKVNGSVAESREEFLALWKKTQAVGSGPKIRLCVYLEPHPNDLEQEVVFSVFFDVDRGEIVWSSGDLWLALAVRNEQDDAVNEALLRIGTALEQQKVFEHVRTYVRK